MAFEYQYQFTQKAEDDLDSIVSYISQELANPTAAKHFISRLQERIEEIRHFPESGSAVVNEFLPGWNIRKKIVNNYLMYYLADTDKKTITVLRIVYGKRNVDEILRKLNPEWK